MLQLNPLWTKFTMVLKCKVRVSLKHLKFSFYSHFFLLLHLIIVFILFPSGFCSIKQFSVLLNLGSLRY